VRFESWKVQSKNDQRHCADLTSLLEGEGISLV
jgi:hypothetical protein